MYIDNMNRILPRGKLLPVPLLSCITFGPPMWLESGEPKDVFLARRAERRAAAQGDSRKQLMPAWNREPWDWWEACWCCWPRRRS